MKFRIALASLMVLALATVGTAQTKISGSSHCGKPEQMHQIEIGDRSGHLFAVVQVKCTWTKPLEVGGTQFKEDLVSAMDEISGNKSRGRGYVVNTTASGDKTFVRTRGSATLKDGMTETTEGEWSFIGGTGKLKGIKGKGTYKGKGGPDGEDYEVEGEYTLPEK